MSTLPTQIFVKYSEDSEYVYGALYEIPIKSNNNISEEKASTLTNKRLIKLTKDEIRKKCMKGL